VGRHAQARTRPTGPQRMCQGCPTSLRTCGTYGLLGEAVQYATGEHGITRDAAVAKLDSLQASLGLTAHQTTQVLKVVRSLRWQVHCFIPEHPARPSEESKYYEPTHAAAQGRGHARPGGHQGDSAAGGARGQGPA
jgi:hypothetical protein